MRGVGSVFGIFLPGNQIPDWFTYQCEGPSVRFEVPTVDRILNEFGVCVAYESRVPVLSPYKGSMSFINHTKNTILTNLAETNGGPFPLGDHLLLRNIVLTNDFEDGDEAEVLVDWGPEIIVKKIAVYLAYERVVVDGKDDQDHAIVVSDDEDDNNNGENRCSSKRKMRSSKIDDSQTLMKAKKRKKLATEENEYSFYSFMTRSQKLHFN